MFCSWLSRCKWEPPSLCPHYLPPRPSHQSVEQVLEERQAEESGNKARSGCRGTGTYNCDHIQAQLSLGTEGLVSRSKECSSKAEEQRSTCMRGLHHLFQLWLLEAKSELAACTSPVDTKTPVAAHSLLQPHQTEEAVIEEEEEYPSGQYSLKQNRQQHHPPVTHPWD